MAVKKKSKDEAIKTWTIDDKEYNIADIANFPWYGGLVLHNIYDAAKFLDVSSYKNVERWAKEIEERPAVQRGRRVNRIWGSEETRLPERHDASDFNS